MRTELKAASVEKLIEHYAGAARQYRVAAGLKDASAAGQNAALVEIIYQELKLRGKNPQNALLPLLEHEDPGVRRWAAAHALEFAPGLGKPVLEKLAKGSGILSLDAQNALREWRGNKDTGRETI